MQIDRPGTTSNALSNEQVRSLTTPLPPQVTVVDRQVKPGTQMLVALALTGKPMYEGTVPAATVARRRAKNKAARHARRVSRR